MPGSDAVGIYLDKAAPWSDYPVRNPEQRAAASDTAYVIFTSGSTGRPKGIVMPHAVLCNLVQWQLQRWGQQRYSHLKNTNRVKKYEDCVKDIMTQLDE